MLSKPVGTDWEQDENRVRTRCLYLRKVIFYFLNMFKFYEVATSLKAYANSSKSKDEQLAIAYGRTSFNRYYYACYLSARDLVKTLIPGIAFQHGEAPQLLEVNVVNLITKSLEQQSKKGLIPAGEAARKKASVHQSAAEISRILKVGYMIRGIADYEPEVVVVFEHNTFSLEKHTESEASSWLRSVEIHKGKILHLAKELGIVS
ncbi:hypothetical protein [Comamonas kerstersii]|uniref:hypothetical protein n=1 Tax=Comamonas kerstersii TaxID=225992 RepID=UPI00266C20F3|nr:hypothetical protein [Comamonas kerstersii]